MNGYGGGIIEYLQSKGFTLKRAGSEYRTDCMFCGDRKGHLYINPVKEVFYCMKCNATGNIWALKKHFGDYDIYRPERKKEVRTFTVNGLTVRGKSYLMRERGFKEEVINEFQLGEKDGMVSIPYILDGQVVGIKYRGIDKKSYIREKDGLSILYNQDRVDKTKDVIVVEGEFDVMAAYQLGYRNVVSTSVGAMGFKNEWMDFFDSCIGKIYIAYDNDEAGDKGADKLAERVGRHRCYRVKLPQKDFNDCLMAGFTKEDIDKYIESAGAYSLDNLVHAAVVGEWLKKKVLNQEDTTGIRVIDMPSFNKYLGGIRESEVTVVTGETGSGKSTWTLNVVYNLIRMGRGALVISTEMDAVKVCGKFCSMYHKKAHFNAYAEELDEFIDWLSRMNCYFVNVRGEMEVEVISEYIRYVRHKYGTDVILLDHLHYFLKPVDNMVQEIERFMKKIVAVALETKTHILLVAHPSKLKNESGIVKMNDIKGGSAIKQDASNIITIWRDKEGEEMNEYSAVFSLEKVRDDSGKIGRFRMSFDPPSQLYREDI